MDFHPLILRAAVTGRYGRHVSSDALVATSRDGAQPRRPRQEETFRKLVDAGLGTLRASSYADLTVRGVAARAQVAPATAAACRRRWDSAFWWRSTRLKLGV